MQVVVVIAIIAFDVVTGLFQALKNKTFTSKKMKSGLWDKAGEIGIVLFTISIVYCQKYVNLGIEIPELLVNGVCAYIILMEISSILENFIKINPRIVPASLKKLFNKESEEEKK